MTIKQQKGRPFCAKKAIGRVVYLVLLLFIVHIGYSYTDNIGGSLGWYLSEGTYNYSNYITIPLNAYMQTLYINVSDERYEDTTIYCYQEFANVSTDCGGLDTGSYAHNQFWEGNSYYNVTDGDYNSSGYHNGVSAFVWVNYTIPLNATSALWQIKHTWSGSPIVQNFSIPSTCLDSDKFQGQVISTNSASAKFECWNGTAYISVFESNHPRIWEEAVFWNISTLSYNASQYYIDGKLAGQGSRLGNYSTQLNHSLINDILDGGCTCSTCNLYVDDCEFYLTYETLNPIDGTQVQLYYTNTTYSYGIDTCSNTFNISSNATSYIMRLYDQETELALQGDLYGSILYNSEYYNDDSTLYPYNSPSVYNQSFCIYPEWAIFNVTATVYYDADGYNSRSYSDISQWSSTLQYLDLYMLNTTSPSAGTLIVKVYDEYENYISGANVKLWEYRPDISSFAEIAQCFSNADGQCNFDVELNTKFYIATATAKIDNVVYFAQSSNYGQVIYTDGETISLYLKGIDNFPIDDLYDLVITPYNTTLVGNISYLTAEFSDYSNKVHNVCIGYYTVNGLHDVLQTENCVNASSGSVNTVGGYLLDRDYTWKAKIYVSETNYTRIYYSYTYQKLSGTFKSEFGLFFAYIIFAIVLATLALGLWLKNMKVFALLSIGFAPLALWLDPALMGGITMSFIIVLGLCILYLTGKKESVT